MVQKTISVLQTIVSSERVSMSISQDMLLKNSRMPGELQLHDGHVA